MSPAADSTRHWSHRPAPTTGANELRRIVSVLDACRESSLDSFTSEELVAIVRACWGSPWDIYPDSLTLDERKFAARHGRLSAACARRLDGANR